MQIRAFARLSDFAFTTTHVLVNRSGYLLKTGRKLPVAEEDNMALLTAQGLIDDGSDDLVVSGEVRANAVTGIASTLLGSGSSGSAGEAGHGSFAVGSFVAIPGPGFFLVPVTGSTAEILQRGASGFTGSLPSAAAFPGGEIMVCNTNSGYDYLLTGTLSMALPVSTGSSGNTMNSLNGSKLLVKGGTVGLKSNSVRWMVMYGSGSMTLSGL
jgi:hypothetical protein